MITIIDKCGECPFYDDEYSSCKNGAMDVSHNNLVSGPPPPDCPLREQSFTFKLNEELK